MKIDIKKSILLFLFLTGTATFLMASGVRSSRGFYSDVAQITGPLDNTGKRLAYLSLVSSARKMGFTVEDKDSTDKICSKLSNPQYSYAVEKASDLVMNKAARAALEAGKMGEKLLKSIINSASQAVEDTKKALKN